MKFVLLILDLFGYHNKFVCFSFQFSPLRTGMSVLCLSYHYVLETNDWFHSNFVPEWIILRESHPHLI